MVTCRGLLVGEKLLKERVFVVFLLAPLEVRAKAGAIVLVRQSWELVLAQSLQFGTRSTKVNPHLEPCKKFQILCM